MKYENVIIGLLSPLLVIIGIVIGSYLSHKSALDLFVQQREREIRERSYASIMGLRVHIMQVQQTLYEAKLLTLYYDFRYHHITHTQTDLDAAKKENQRMLDLIPEVSIAQRELATTLGDIRLSYEISNELEEAIETLRKFQTIKLIEPDPGKITTIKQLKVWKEKATKQIQSLLEEEWNKPIEIILPLLFNQIKKH